MAIDTRNYATIFDGSTIGERAVVALGESQQFVDEAVESLLSISTAANKDARRAAARGVGSFRSTMPRVQENTVVKLRKLTERPEEEARYVGVWLLGYGGSEEDKKHLRVCLEDASFRVRKQAATSLGRIAPRESMALLASPSWALRSGVAEGIGQIADEQLLKEVQAFEREHRDVASRPIWLMARGRKDSELRDAPNVDIHFEDLP